MPSNEEEDELPLMWQKLSNRLLQSLDKCFNKFEQSFQSLLSAQQALTERLCSTENQAADHEQRIQAVEILVGEMQKENKRLWAKLLDLKGRSQHNNIKIVRIQEERRRGGQLNLFATLFPSC